MDGVGGPDHSAHSPAPFLIATPSRNRLIEVPVTIIATYALFREAPALLRAYRSLPVRAVRRLLLSRWLLPQPMWLTPDPRYRAEDLAAVWRSAERLGLDAAVMMFHSSELMPGGSPFRQDAQSVRELLACLHAFFGFVREAEGEFSTLSAIAAGIPERRLQAKAL